MQFITDANLPQKNIGYVCISEKTPKSILLSLKQMNITPIFVPSAKDISSPVSSHADVILHHLYKNHFVCEPTLYEYFKKVFNRTDIVLNKGGLKVNNTYPSDCAYNAARIKDYLFANIKNTDKTILDFKGNVYTKKININQGYAKCSICIVNENALITSDESIFTAATNNGFDVLKIRCGYIEIEKYDYGFIGGTSGLLSKDILAFCGDLKHHPDADNIRAFLRNFNVYPISLKNGALCDIGSILPIAYA